MRLGCTGPLEQLAPIQAAGYDYLAVDAQLVLRGEQSSQDWNTTAPDPNRLELPIEVAYRLLPRNRPVIGPDRDPIGLQDYMQHMAKRAEHLGIACLILDSGDARHRPEGVSLETAWRELEEFVGMAGQVCAHHGVNLAIEPLHPETTNTINKVHQARYLCDRVGHRSVGVTLADDLLSAGLATDQEILDLGDRLRHVNLTPPADDRPVSSLATGHHDALKPPQQSRGVGHCDTRASDLDHFLCVLRKGGYDGPLTVRSGSPGEIAAGGPEWVGRLRRAWDAAGRWEADSAGL